MSQVYERLQTLSPKKDRQRPEAERRISSIHHGKDTPSTHDDRPRTTTTSGAITAAENAEDEDTAGPLPAIPANRPNLSTVGRCKTSPALLGQSGGFNEYYFVRGGGGNAREAREGARRRGNLAQGGEDLAEDEETGRRGKGDLRQKHKDDNVRLKQARVQKSKEVCACVHACVNFCSAPAGCFRPSHCCHNIHCRTRARVDESPTAMCRTRARMHASTSRKSGI